ncbi:hypothetical protein NDU88_003284 [Pleurodeles waltl]|uniref:Uncharacterized protein n=1 Tax=Pleurodeles waltl TaxID=8319 RepID=A0AAV7VFS9_PLEWA|nr:hypothetical protein NDU88_003284 [Pleurodeles waltl]
MGRGTVSSRSLVSRQPFLGALRSSPLLPPVLSRSSSMSRSRCADGDRVQNPNNCSGASRTSPLLLTAPLAGPLPGPGRPERGRHPDSSAGRPVRVCDGTVFRCSTFVSVQAFSHPYLLVFTCSAWEFGVLAGSFYRLWTELSLERPFMAPS